MPKCYSPYLFLPCRIDCRGPNLRNVLLKSFGWDLAMAGLWKLLWSICVIMGAFFFVRTLQFYVNDHKDVSSCCYEELPLLNKHSACSAWHLTTAVNEALLLAS